jgi:hypothetical protein
VSTHPGTISFRLTKQQAAQQYCDKLVKRCPESEVEHPDDEVFESRPIRSLLRQNDPGSGELPSGCKRPPVNQLVTNSQSGWRGHDHGAFVGAQVTKPRMSLGLYTSAPIDIVVMVTGALACGLLSAGALYLLIIGKFIRVTCTESSRSRRTCD